MQNDDNHDGVFVCDSGYHGGAEGRCWWTPYEDGEGEGDGKAEIDDRNDDQMCGDYSDGP